MIYPDFSKRTSKVQNKTSVEKLKLIIQMYNEDIKIVKIAETVGVTRQTVTRLIQQERKHPTFEDLVPKQASQRIKQLKITEELKDEVCTLFNQNMKIYEIAKQCEISTASVRNIVKERANIALQNQKDSYIAPKFEDVLRYVFEHDTNRKLSFKNVEKEYKHIIDSYTEDWQQYIDKILEEK